ncbi:MAG: AAA family ATPase [Myxococcota bacterium]
MAERWNEHTKGPRRVLRVASRIADVAARFVEKHPKLAAITVAARGVDALLDEFEVGPWSAFDDWQYLYLGELQKTVFEVLNTHFEPTTVARERGSTALVFHLGDAKLGFIRYSGHLYGPYMPATLTEEGAWRDLGAALWRALGPRIRVGLAADHSPILLADPLEGALPSERAMGLLRDIRAYRKKGYRRAVLLYGESGTGKSYMTRWIASELGGLTLRVHARDLARTESLLGALTMMRPTALLIDDICRLSDPAEIMDCFESVKASSELVLATANKLSGIDAAILRPGRFDDTIEITDVGRGVRADLLAELPETIRAGAADLPMAYLEELRIRVDVLGPERALEQLLDLAQRRARISSETSDSKEGDAEVREDSEGAKGEEE